jgi:hypothetical protein
MKVFGMDENFFAQLPPVNAHLGANDPSLQRIASAMLNRPARVTVNQRSWNGQMRNNITAIKAPLGPAGVVAPQAAAPRVPAATPQPTPMQAPAPAQPAPAPVSPPAPAAPLQQPAASTPQVPQPAQQEVPPMPQPPAPPQPPQELAF